MRYEVLSGDLATLRADGIAVATTCLASELSGPVFEDSRPSPAPGSGTYYLTRGRNVCGLGSSGSGRESLDDLACPVR